MKLIENHLGTWLETEAIRSLSYGEVSIKIDEIEFYKRAAEQYDQTTLIMKSGCTITVNIEYNKLKTELNK